MTIDILIILNNFIHDLAAAMWFCGTLALLVIVREGAKEQGSGAADFVKIIFRKIKRITNTSLAVVFAGGVVRALAYQKYEWQPALGRDQITLLVIKHILLGGIVLAGIYLQIRLSHRMKYF